MHPDIARLLQLQTKDVALLEADRALDLVLAELEALDQQLAEQAAARRAGERDSGSDGQAGTVERRGTAIPRRPLRGA